MPLIIIKTETNEINVVFGGHSVTVPSSTLTAGERSALAAIVAKLRGAGKAARLSDIDAERARAVADE